MRSVAIGAGVVINELDAVVRADRTTTREWHFDLSRAGAVRSPKVRPANRRRQKIARFGVRDGDVETFTIRQTVPYRGYEAECPPSPAQYIAVLGYFLEPSETRHQANVMLCARDYAAEVARGFSFTAPRKEFISLCVSAFILGNPELRSRVQAWNIRNGPGNIACGIASHKPYKTARTFAEKLIDDMRGSGSLIFG